LAAAIAAFLIGFGAYGVLSDDFEVPAWGGHGPPVGIRHYYHFHGAAAWLMSAGFVCLGASVVVVISRRLKAKPGEKTDQRVAKIMARAGGFIILAMMARLWRAPPGALRSRQGLQACFCFSAAPRRQRPDRPRMDAMPLTGVIMQTALRKPK
jgi:hypothetical protein